MYEILKYVIIIYMKILFITDLYPINEGEKQTPLTLHNFAFQWIRQGHQVDVIKPNFVFNSFLRKKPFYKDGFYQYHGVKIFNVNYLTPFLFDFMKKMPKSIDFKNYDLIIAHMPSGVIFANKIAEIFKKPLICGVHVSDLEVLTLPIYSLYFRNQMQNAYKNSKKIACRSFVLQKKFCALFPELADKTFVAASGIELDEKMQRGKEAKQNHSVISVLTCANLVKRKNIDKLILALNDLEDFELTVIGDGQELKRLRRVGLLSHSQKPKFLGRLPHEKVLEEMENSDIFVLPSVNETFGMVYLEAMASGCVTVGTKNDGIDGIIEDSKNGFLCSPTVSAIKETLLKIKNHGNIEEIIKNSFETIKNYTPEKCAEKYFED